MIGARAAATVLVAAGVPTAAVAAIGCGCEEAGCSSGVFVEVLDAPRGREVAPRARLCVDGRCRTTRVRGGRSLLTSELEADAEREVAVRVEVRDRRGRLLGRPVARTLTLERSRPNGESCPPTCFAAGLKLSVRRGVVR